VAPFASALSKRIDQRCSGAPARARTTIGTSPDCFDGSAA